MTERLYAVGGRRLRQIGRGKRLVSWLADQLVILVLFAAISYPIVGALYHRLGLNAFLLTLVPLAVVPPLYGLVVGRRTLGSLLTGSSFYSTKSLAPSNRVLMMGATMGRFWAPIYPILLIASVFSTTGGSFPGYGDYNLQLEDAS